MTSLRVRRGRDTKWTLAAAVAGTLALLVAAFALFAHEVEVSWRPFVLVASFAHQLMWAAPVAAVLFAITRRWYACGVAGLAVLLVVMTQAPLYVGTHSSTRGRGLTVLQANLRLGQASPASLVATVTSRHVDVLVTEELTYHERDHLLAAGLARRLPYHFDAPFDYGGGGLGIWSRFPLSTPQNHPGFDLGVLSAQMRVSSAQSVTIFAAHLRSPYASAAKDWAADIGRLRSVLDEPAPPRRQVIVAGDFNATIDHAQFRGLLTSGYEDAAEHSGAGYLASYPTDRWFPPMIAIDHVLTKNATATSASTLALAGSDHRGLLVQLRLQS